MISPLSILHLEDSANDAKLVQALLESEGCASQITWVQTGAEFSAALSERAFDLILSDYALPSFDGMAALRLVRQECPDTPLIFVSGTLGEDAAVDCLKQGATDYVVKHRLSRLLPAIQRVLREREEHQKRKEAESQVRHGAQLFRQITESATDLIAVLDLEGKWLHMSASYRAFLNEAALGPGIDSFSQVYPEDRERMCQLFNTTAREGVSGREQFRFLSKDQSIRFIESQFSPIRNEAGTIVNVVSVSRDVTERKRAEEIISASLREKEVLLKEIHHRVKNNMQVVCSLLSLQSARITDPAALSCFRESHHRVKCMALLHEKLYQSADLSRIDFSGYLHNLLDYLFSSFGTNPATIQCRVDVQDVRLSMDAAIPCGLIVNELASNALKYAFADRSSGEVSLAMKREADGLYHLRFHDNGVGLPANFAIHQTKSLGLKLVTMLTKQLHGTVELEHGDGTGFHIAFHDGHDKQP